MVSNTAATLENLTDCRELPLDFPESNWEHVCYLSSSFSCKTVQAGVGFSKRLTLQSLSHAEVL